jgi:hypothetical protein
MTYVLAPKHYRDRDLDPQLLNQSKKNAEKAKLSQARQTAIEDYRRTNPNKRENASALAKHFATLWGVNERTLRRQIGKLIK